MDFPGLREVDFSTVESLRESPMWIAQEAELERVRQTLVDIAAENRSEAGAAPPFIRCNARLVIDPNGRLALRDALLDALIGVPAERIRSCVVCDRIFWAARINSECCSVRCRKTHNQRNSRKARRILLSKKSRSSNKGR
jgi:hypothetical protein